MWSKSFEGPIIPPRNLMLDAVAHSFLTTYVYRKALRLHGQKKAPRGGPRKDSVHSQDSYRKKKKGPRKKCPVGKWEAQRAALIKHRRPQEPVIRPSRIGSQISSPRPAAPLKARSGSGPDLVPSGSAAPPSAAAASTAASGGAKRRESELVGRHQGGSGRYKGPALTPTSWLPEVCRGA